MASTIQKYLRRAACHERWPLETASVENVNKVVVIPVLAESASLFQTLDDLANNPGAQRAETLVVCVVNNRDPGQVSSESIRDNQAVLEMLRHEWSTSSAPLRLAIVDASSPGRELPPKEGVGLARKIGMDHALAVLAPRDGAGLIISLDADTRVDTNYLSAIEEKFAEARPPGAVIAFAHPLDGAPAEIDAIARYEVFLRHYVVGLRYAGSPYAFHSIGSAMACTAEAYAAVAGMPRRQAGEDFYFLQKLAKLGPIAHVEGTIVHPSGRRSERVPFGTGAAIVRHDSEPDRLAVLHNPATFGVLRAWLQLMLTGHGRSADELMADAHDISPQLGRFLRDEGYETDWTRLRQHNPDPQRLLAQAHRWFDGFRTLKLIHHLRDHGFPSKPMADAVYELLALASRGSGGSSVHAADPVALLDLLRAVDKPDSKS